MYKKSFTISIGEYGVVVALHDGNSVKNKILLASLEDGHKPQLVELFAQNKKVPTYILVDTNSQNYKRKAYPPIREFDLRKIAKRDAEKEDDPKEKAFKAHYYFRNKIQKKWDCTFVSTIETDEISKWEEFLMSLPNEFIGIYMLPIETYHLAKAIFDIAKKEYNIPASDNHIISFIIQNKISGIRQTIFYNQTILFTRVVSYDPTSKNFSERFEQDLFRAGEYLKMIFPNLKSQDVTMINVLSDDIVDKIKRFKSHDFRMINYSPFDIAEKTGLSNIITKNTSNFSDVLIANFFANDKKKILKFSNNRINFLSRLNLVIKSILGLNSVIIIIILIFFLKITFSQTIYKGQVTELRDNRIKMEKQLQDISNAALNLDENSEFKGEEKNIMADKVIDFGKIHEVLSVGEVNITEVFNKLSFIQKYGAIADSFAYQIPNLNPKAATFVIKGTFTVNGTISDPSGDVEVLFKKFDAMSLDTKNKFPDYTIKYSELSRNIDFSKKYYSFPFDLNLEKK